MPDPEKIIVDEVVVEDPVMPEGVDFSVTMEEKEVDMAEVYIEDLKQRLKEGRTKRNKNEYKRRKMSKYEQKQRRKKVKHAVRTRQKR